MALPGSEGTKAKMESGCNCTAAAGDANKANAMETSPGRENTLATIFVITEPAGEQCLQEGENMKQDNVEER